MIDESGFRTTDQEVLKLLEEFVELKRTLKTISGQLSRLENRVKATFPAAAEKMQERRTKIVEQKANSLTSEDAQKEFEHIVQMARSGATSEAESYLERQSALNLLSIAKEVGVTFRNNKPSIKAMREAILGKVRESILLSQHSPRN